MNILYAVHHFPPKFSGGAELRAQRTATFMQRKGYKVNVVCVEQITFGKQKRLEVKEEIFQEGAGSYNLQMQEFGDCILRHRDPETGGTEGLRALAVIEAMTQSVAQSRAIDVADILA